MESEHEIFDIVDKMRSLGLDIGVDIPQIVVCGDQSSGKSSVLERIADVMFPTKDTLCTRFATELVLRKGIGPKKLIFDILPSNDCNKEDRERLNNFKAPYAHLGNLDLIYEAAKQAMGLEDNTQSFSNHVLRIRIEGPNIPNLTLVDLPGIFHGKGAHQTVQDVNKVKELVLNYMKQPRTIILAIISAGNELPNQVITTWMEMIDPNGVRTLGILTKPDLLEDSPGKAKEFLKLVQNEEIVLELGWHVLRNRKLKESHLSKNDFNQVEAEYLTRDIWEKVLDKDKGIGALMKKLSTLYEDHIKTEAIPLARDLERALTQCSKEIEEKELEVRSFPTGLELQFGDIGDRFSSLVSSAVLGEYSDDFFRNQAADEPRQVEIRALVEETLSQFRLDMMHHGHDSELVVLADEHLQDPSAAPVDAKTRADFLSTISQRLARSGSIAGHFNSALVSDMFYEQSTNWLPIVSKLGDHVCEIVRTGLLEIIRFAGGNTMGDVLWKAVVEPGLQVIEADLRLQTLKEMKSHVEKRKVILAKHITSKIQQATKSELRYLLGERVPSLLQPGGLVKQLTIHSSTSSNAILRTKIVDCFMDGLSLERLPSAEILYCVQLYYRDALSKVLNRFDLTSFEEWVMNKLPSLCNRQSASSLPREQIQSLDSEDNQRQVELQGLKGRQEALQEALVNLRRVGQRELAKRHASDSLMGKAKRHKMV